MKKIIAFTILTATIFVALFSCKKDKPAEKTLVSIAISVRPVKTIYNLDDMFDPAGMTVIATYSDGSTAPVTITADMLSYDFNTAGTDKTVIITVTYEGKTASATLTGISVNPPADIIPPTLSAGAVNRTGDTQATIGFTTDEAGTAYYLVLESDSQAPTAEEIRDSGTSLGAVTAGDVAGKAVELTAGAKAIYVVVADAAGNNSDPLKIAVEAYGVAPVIITHPANTSVLEGETAIFIVVATENPEYLWEVERNAGGTAVWEPITGAYSDTLTLVNVSLDMNGNRYRCILSNGIAPDAASEPATLMVHSAPLFGGGDGSSDSPYLINNAADLKMLSEMINAGMEPYANEGMNYLLTADISLPAVAAESPGNHTPIGTDANRFRGHFNGNGKTISTLTINSADSSCIGLFGAVGGGTITNLELTDVNIHGHVFIGGVAGYIYGNGARISGCYVTGAISGSHYVGGIAGHLDYSVSISNCYTACSVVGNSNINGGIGGIAGINSSSTISNCYATGAVSGPGFCGGIVGFNSGTVSSCLALNPSINKIGNNAIGTYFGRVAGVNMFLLTNNAAYSEMSTDSGVSFASGEVNGTGISADQAKMQTSYSGLPRNWAFGTSDAAPWKWLGSSDYLLPVLYWQDSPPAPLPEHLE